MNTLLGNIHNCEDEAAVKEYTALVKFWRAYFYANMVRKFGDVPWYEVELGSADEALYNARDSRETILQHMLDDIDCAIEDLPGKASAPQTAYRVNKYTAMILKAQFCLFEGTFRKYHSSPAPFETSYTAADGTSHDYKFYLQQAADAAKMLMETNAYKLFSTGKPNSDYLTLFTTSPASPTSRIPSHTATVTLLRASPPRTPTAPGSTSSMHSATALTTDASGRTPATT